MTLTIIRIQLIRKEICEVLIVTESLSHMKIWPILLKMVTKTKYPDWKDGLIQGTDGIWTNDLLFTGQAL